MSTQKNPHLLSCDEALAALESRREGLTTAEAAERLSVHGHNQLAEGEKDTLLKRFMNQFKDLMIIILVVAALISGLLGEVSDTIIILLVVIVNAVIGVAQEYKAEKALDALKKMTLPITKVRRGGEVEQIASGELVPGDIVLLDAGDIVPADMRLLSASSLKIEEAALTGESVPAEKHTDPLTQPDMVINDMRNMAFSSSFVVYGRAEGIVVSTGMNTEVGKIASLLMAQDDEQTPLQKKLHETSKLITWAILAIAVITFAVGIAEGRPILDMLLISISLAVAAIPEGLPAIITIVLALGVQTMAKENAIIRKLSAVETLGCTEIICTDKTGTLTQNRMTVTDVYLNSTQYPLDQFDPAANDTAKRFVKAAVLCNDSKLNMTGDAPSVMGDPTENALIYMGLKLGADKNVLEGEMPRTFDLPFDSERKMMSVVNTWENSSVAIVKGAPDILLHKCTHIEISGQRQDMTEEVIEEIKRANSHMASQALRILAIAYKPLNEAPNPDTLEESLIFLGLVGMIDPPREEVKDAVASTKKAGIRTIMITGDHRDTAFAIAKQLGIADHEDQVIIGSELNAMTDEDFEEMVEHFRVYARVSPEHKLKIVRAWKHKGKIVAMTGDGVNDAPALKISDIGIGMGITGTDVTKSVSNMVLADDNFATIVVAVEEGRRIYANITKAIQFLLSCNLGEVITVFVATLMGWQALLPIHILWINLVTDSLPALALGVDQSKVSSMNKKPRKPDSNLFSGLVGTSIIYQGVLEGVITLGVYAYAMNHYDSLVATTMCFMTLGFIQLTHSMNVRSNTQSIFTLGFLTNKALLLAIGVSGFLQGMVVFIPGFREFFKVAALNGEQWLIVIGSCLSINVIVEIVKFFIRKTAKTEA